MYQHTRLTNNNFGFLQKFKNFDYILLACILLLGFISLTTMYSTDGGKVLFHTKSHFTKLFVFTAMMLIFSFINIKFWFSVGYLSYETISYFEKKVPKNKESTLNVPESIFMITDSIVVFDHVKQTIFIVNYAKIDDSKDINDVYTKSLEKIDEIYCLIKKPIPEEHNNISSISNNEEKTKETH